MFTRKTHVRALATGATVALVLPVFAFLPGASAATKDTGDAGSTATVLKLRVGDQVVEAIGATLGASTIASPAEALVRVVPVALNGTAVGEQTVTNNSQTLGTESQGVAGLLSLSSPSIKLDADSNSADGPIAKLTSTSLGDASLLGINLPAFNGKLDFGSSVVQKTSDASKTVVVEDLALPSLADLLGNLGLDLTKLPLGVLENLVDALDRITGAITTAINDRLDAISDLGSAEDALDAVQDTLNDATGDVASATTALVNALGAGNSILGTIPTTIAGWNAANQGGLLGLLNLLPGGAAAVNAINSADAALDAANAALGVAQNAVNTALALVDTLTNTVLGLTDTVINLLVNALDTPLVSLGKLEVGTIANAGAKHVAKVTGSISGLQVLGTNVLQTVLGSNSIDIVDLLGSKLNQVQGSIDGVLGQVSSILNGVAGLDVALPKVEVLKQSTSKADQGQYEGAAASVMGLAVSWGGLNVPSISLPANLAVPGAGALEAVVAVANGFVSEGFAVEVANLTENARYLAATANTPTPVNPGTPNNPNNPNSPNNPNNPNSPNSPNSPTPGNLPTTGAPVLVAISALALLATAFGIRRFHLGHL